MSKPAWTLGGKPLGVEQDAGMTGRMEADPDTACRNCTDLYLAKELLDNTCFLCRYGRAITKKRRLRLIPNLSASGVENVFPEGGSKDARD